MTMPAITGLATYTGIPTPPAVTGKSTYQGPNSNNGTVQTTVASQYSTYVASSPTAVPNNIASTVSPVTGKAVYQGPNSNNGTVVTVATAKNTPQS
jgi:hypothetical protein